jgi:N,N'-diacetyllegionaminate synthase
MKGTFIIAEAGVNHNGSVEMAKKLIKEAKMCGADCVKFQTFKAERVVIKKAPKAHYQMQTTDPKESQLEMLRKLELPDEAYQELMQICADEGVMFLSTPYGVEDIDFLDSLGVAAFKVASGQIVEPHFLEHVARKGKPMIVSTGMATLSEVDEAVRLIMETLKSAEEGDQPLPSLTLLQCTTNYPSLLEDANLKAMETMRRTFGLPVGYSDHTEGIVACIAAVALGARIIEKHFTLDRTLPGPDQSCSSNPDEFRQMVNAIRQAEAVLGTGTKKPSERERENAATMRRSIVALRNIPAGRTIEPDDITFKRPLSGIPASHVGFVLGKRTRASLKKDDFLEFEIISK